jgi:hypothetical protein
MLLGGGDGRLGPLPLGQLRDGLLLLEVEGLEGVVDGDLGDVPRKGPWEFFFFFFDGDERKKERKKVSERKKKKRSL